MTCREKLKIEHPDKVDNITGCGCAGCPSGYGYLPDPYYCKYMGDPELCTKCWDREIPEIEENKEEVKMEEERKFYSCTEISQMSDFEKNGLIANLQNDIYIKDKECDELKVKLNAKDAEIHYLRSMYDDVDEKFEELRKDSSQLIRKNVDLKRDMIILKDTVSDRESFIEKIKKENTELCNCIKNNDETIGSLKKEIDKLKTENKNLAESNYVLDDHIDEYEFVIKEADKKKAELEDKNRKLKDERDWLESCYHSCVEESRSRAEKIKKLEKEKDDLDHILHSKIEALEGDIECRKKDLEYKNDHINHLIERLDDQRKKIEDLENGDVLPYFIRKVVGDKLKEDPCCWATTAEKRNRIENPFCKSVPCSEAIKQLEKNVDDIPCIKAKKTRSELDDAIKDYIMKTPTPICWDDYWPINHLGEWNIIDPPYNKIAEHMMRKYQALRHAGFDHDTALSFIPMWSDE